MSRFKTLTHVLWHCQTHLVWVPKYRYRVLTGAIGAEVHNCIEVYCSRLRCEVVELNVQPDHVHSVPRSRGGNDELSINYYFQSVLYRG